MQEIFVARQPIYNRNLDVIAYELLFRDSPDNCARISDGVQATGQVLLNSLVEIGLDSLVGDRMAFINLPQEFITGHHVPPLEDRIVLEILEDVEPDAVVLAELQELAREGYRFALDDFVYSPDKAGLLQLAEIVKIDIRAVDLAILERLIPIIRGYGVSQVLAEKVETLEEFEVCKAMGFDLFQGYFLSKPRIVRQKTVSTNRLAALELLAQLQDPAVNMEQLETIIGRDLQLSYKVLQYVNSSAVGIKRRVDSVRHAIALLGVQRLKTLVTLIALSRVDDKPVAIMQTALLRANLCRLLGRALRRADEETFYLVGLFSVLGILLDSTLEDALSDLPLSHDIRDALSSHEGAMGEVLRCTLAIEEASWNEVHCLGLTLSQINQAHLEAIQAVKEQGSVFLKRDKDKEKEPEARPSQRVLAK